MRECFEALLFQILWNVLLFLAGSIFWKKASTVDICIWGIEMIKRWKRYFVIYWKIQLQNIKSLEQYRADFFMMLFFTTLSQDL